jgi:hypothetical protein
MSVRDGIGFGELEAVVSAHGHQFDTRPLDALTLRSVSDDLVLPSGFSSLYADRGPAERSSIPWVIEEMLIFSFGELPAAQAGYRWVGPERTPSPSWPPTWVVVASVFGDPFFIDTSRDGCPVLFARHGAGSWSPTEIASSMELFIVSLVQFESVLLDGFDLDVWNDDGLLPEFVGEVERKLADVLTAEQASGFAGLLS